MSTTTNMGMVLPDVGVTLDPTWANLLNAALTSKLDTHDHTSGKGVQVPTAGILINNDLGMNHFNLLTINTLQLDNQLSSPPIALASPNGLLVRYNDDLWFQKSGSVAVQITSGSALNLGAVATNIFSRIAVSASRTILAADTFTYLATTSAGGVINITLPAANSVTAGRYYIIKDVGGVADTNAINIIPAGANTIDNVASTRSINIPYGAFFVISNGSTGWNLFRDGHLAATATALGVIQLAGDLAGSGTTAASPKVLKATTGVPGLIQLAGDLAGGTYLLPIVKKITGTAGAASIAAGTTLTVPATAKIDLNTGGMDVNAGVIAVKNGGSITTASGSTVAIASGTTYSAYLNASSVIQMETGSHLNVASGATETVGGQITMLSGATLEMDPGVTINWFADLPISAVTTFKGNALVDGPNGGTLSGTDVNSNVIQYGQFASVQTADYGTAVVTATTPPGGTINVTSGDVWHIEINGTLQCGGGAKMGFTYPGGSTIRGAIAGEGVTGTYLSQSITTTGLGATSFSTSSGGVTPIRVWATVQAGATGSIAFVFASSTAAQNANFRQGAVIKAFRVA